MNNSIIYEYWQNFCKKHHINLESYYTAYSFGTADMADELANLVKNGIKTATSSAFELYEKNERIPQIDDYNIILDSQNNPVCVTQTKVVEIVPFNQIMVEHAYHEGEGNRTYKYWYDAHIDFFTKEYAEFNKIFTETESIVCEVFAVID